jgi:8-oxo-dGTP pyrophosphatase MutT (NUDIX family)
MILEVIMGTVKSCGAVVYRISAEEIEFLAIKSKGDEHWVIPKGHVEKGESEEETAKREVFEEAGLNVILLDGLRTRVEYTQPDGRLLDKTKVIRNSILHILYTHKSTPFANT